MQLVWGGTVATTTTTTTTPAPMPPVSVSAPSVGADLKLPKQLPSVEEELKILVAAVEDLRQPNLSRNEASRLHYIIQGVQVYQRLFAEYVNYRGLETEVLELRRQLAPQNDKEPA